MAERPTVTVLRPDDASVVPDPDHEAVTLVVTVARGARVTDADVERVVDAAGHAVPGLRDRLLWHEVRTPSDVADATGADGGSVPAPALAAASGLASCTRRTAHAFLACSPSAAGRTRAAGCRTRGCRARWRPG